jgi:hypothetical protein
LAYENCHAPANSLSEFCRFFTLTLIAWINYWQVKMNSHEYKDKCWMIRWTFLQRFHYRCFASAGKDKIGEGTNYFGFLSRAKRRARGLRSPSGVKLWFMHGCHVVSHKVSLFFVGQSYQVGQSIITLITWKNKYNRVNRKLR